MSPSANIGESLRQSFPDAPTNQLDKIASQYANDPEYAFAQAQNFVTILENLQKRYPDITEIALSEVAASSAGVSEAIGKVNQLQSVASQLQDTDDDLDDISAQIIAAYNLDNLANALRQAADLDSLTRELTSQLGVSPLAARILAAIETVGELGNVANNTGQLRSTISQFTQNINLGQTANEIVVALNLFTPGNVIPAAAKVQSIVPEIKSYDPGLWLDNATAATIGALSLGNLPAALEYVEAYKKNLSQLTNSYGAIIDGDDLRQAALAHPRSLNAAMTQITTTFGKNANLSAALAPVLDNPETLEQLQTVLGGLGDLETVSRSLSSLTVLADKLNDLASLADKITDLNKLLDQLGDLDELVNQLKTLDTLIGEASKLSDAQTVLGELEKMGNLTPIITKLDILGQLVSSLDEINDLVAHLGNLETILAELDDLKRLIANLDELNRLLAGLGSLDQLINIIGQLADLTNLLDQLGDIRAIVDEFGDIQNLIAQLGDLDQILSQLTDLRNLLGQLGEMQKLLSSLSDLGSLLGQFSNLADLVNNLSSLTNVFASLTNLANLAGNFQQLTNLFSNFANLSSLLANFGNLTNLIGNLDSLGSLAADLSSVGSLLTGLSNISGAINQIGNLSGMAGEIATLNSALNGAGNLGTLATNVNNLAGVVGKLSVGAEGLSMDDETESSTAFKNGYIENNLKAIAKYSDKNLARHLIMDGYQVYRSPTNVYNSRYLNSVHEDNYVDFQEATVPLLRANNYSGERLNSAETYYGYSASKVFNPGDNSNLLMESSWVAKISSPAKCSLKTANLFYIKHKCMNGDPEPSCEQLYVGPDGKAQIRGSHYTIEELTRKVTAEIGDDHEFDGRMPYCESLYGIGFQATSEAVIREAKNLTAEQKEKLYIRLAIENLDFYLNQYRTGYIVQVNRICPVQTQGRCSLPIYKYPAGPYSCNWHDVPDQVRVYPFRYPDLFSNKNFCDQSAAGYPENCDVSQDFSYADMFEEYYDPALNHKNFLLSLPQMQKMRAEQVAQRKVYADAAAQQEITGTDQTINCLNCSDNLQKALVKIINSLKKGYYTDLDQTENGVTDALGSSQIATSAINNVEGSIENNLSYNDRCIRCTGSGFHRHCRTYYAQAQISYWIIIPMGVETEEIETVMTTPFFNPDSIKKFLKDDKRQYKKLDVAGVETTLGNVKTEIPGAGPITNIFFQQEALYNPDSVVYQGFKNCPSIVDYFENRCAGGTQTSTGQQ